MDKVNHINILNEMDRVYCRKLNKVEVLERCPCTSCTKFNGTAQGEGVECLWVDEEVKDISRTVYDPNDEFDRLNNT